MSRLDVFDPLRKRIRRSVDRRFNRSAYRATVMRRTTALRSLISRRRPSIDLQPETSGIWLKPGDSETPRQ